MQKHGLYKYVYKDCIIYIGKSNANLLKRALSHLKEDKFHKYKDSQLHIYLCNLPNSTETDLLERALINKYKPILNVIDNNKGFSGLINCNEPEWIEYNEYPKEKNDISPKQPSNNYLLGKIGDAEIWLINEYITKTKGKNVIAEMYENRQQAFKMYKSLIDIVHNYGREEENEIISVDGEYIDRNISLLVQIIDRKKKWPVMIIRNKSFSETLSIFSAFKGKDETLTELRVYKHAIKILDELL